MKKIKITVGNCYELLVEIRNLAIAAYGIERTSSLEKYYELYKKCPKAFLVVQDIETEKVVGYNISLPLTKEYFNMTISPNYTEDDLTPDKVIDYHYGVNYIYFFSIVIDRSYEHRLIVLREMRFKQEIFFRRQIRLGRYINSTSALSYSDSGIKICLGLGMKSVGTNKKGTVFVNKGFDRKLVAKNIDDKNIILRNFTKNKLKQNSVFNKIKQQT